MKINAYLFELITQEELENTATIPLEEPNQKEFAYLFKEEDTNE